MNCFFDTTVLVAASSRAHPHFAQAFPAFRRVIRGRDKGFISLHSVAEVYASLTRMPVAPRIHPSEAARIVTENLLPHFETVPAMRKEYLEAVATVERGGWAGAKIYDALILNCAIKSGADRIYTFNLADFRLLAPAAVREKICVP